MGNLWGIQGRLTEATTSVPCSTRSYTRSFALYPRYPLAGNFQSRISLAASLIAALRRDLFWIMSAFRPSGLELPLLFALFSRHR